MATTNPSRSLSAMAAGAALLSCSFASAQNLLYSTLDSCSATATLGATTGTGSVTGPTTYAWNSLNITSGTGYGHLGCWNGVYSGTSYDLFGSNISVYTPSGVASFTQSFTITLNKALKWELGSFNAGWSVAWTIDGNPVADGDLIAAGQRVLAGTATYSGTAVSSLYFTSGFYLPPGGGVPLPGAASLAAVGLVGLRGRRRR
jgi:hypothetical protein